MKTPHRHSGDNMNKDKATILANLTQPEQEPWCMKMNGCKTKCKDCPDEAANPDQEQFRDCKLRQALIDFALENAIKPNSMGDKLLFKSTAIVLRGMPITAIKEALAQPEQEPVLQDIEQYRMQMAGICTAAIGYWKEGDNIHPDYNTVALRDVAKLYAKYDALYKARWSAQPKRQPLTDEQAMDLLPTNASMSRADALLWVLRATERAHGIKETT